MAMRVRTIGGGPLEQRWMEAVRGGHVVAYAVPYGVEGTGWGTDRPSETEYRIFGVSEAGGVDHGHAGLRTRSRTKARAELQRFAEDLYGGEYRRRGHGRGVLREQSRRRRRSGVR
jgi:hypothetical protein